MAAVFILRQAIRTLGTWAMWLTACLAGGLITVLAAALPADGFYAGDSGVKLIAAYNAIQHPSRPFQIDLPVIGGERMPLVERFFWVHGTHAHALQSPVFPVVSAPFIAAFGIRGAYVVPALSFVLLVPSLFVIARRAAPDISRGLVLTMAIAASRLSFYAFEFWEHLPAAACLAAAAAIVLAPRGQPASTAQTALAGY